MLRKALLTTALAGALVLGTAGPAPAAPPTPSGAAPSSTAPPSTTPSSATPFDTAAPSATPSSAASPSATPSGGAPSGGAPRDTAPAAGPAAAATTPPADGTGTFTGTYSQEDGTPIPSSTVCVETAMYTGSGYHTYSGTTDAAGHYTITGVVPDRYRVRFSLPGNRCVQYAHHSTMFNGEVFTMAAGQVVTVDETQLPAGTLSGRILDATGAPVPNATVSAVDPEYRLPGGSTRTDSSGRFEFQVPVGRYAVSVSANNVMQWVPQRQSRDQATLFDVRLGERTVVDETAVQTGSVAGVVRDYDGRPAGRIFVDVEDVDTRLSTGVLTDGNGAYQITGLFPGTYRVRIGTIEYTRWQYVPSTFDLAKAATFRVAGGKTTTVDEQFLPVGSLDLAITDAVTGAPVTGACASMNRGLMVREACADSTGHVLLTDLPQSDGYSVLVDDTARAHLRTYVQGTVTGGQTTPVPVRLTPTASITTTVRDAATGQPVAGVCVQPRTLRDPVLQEPEYGLDGCSAADGTVTIGHLAAGTYTLMAHPTDDVYGAQWVGAHGGTGDQYQAAQITVTPGQTVAAPEILLDRAGSITGTVTDAATGAPVDRVCVAASPVSTTWEYQGCYPGTVTDADGRFTIPRLGPYAWPVLYAAGSDSTESGERQPARYAWQWSGDAVDRTTATPVQVTAGQTVTADAHLAPGGAVRATVVDHAGVPQVEAVVVAYDAVSKEPVGACMTDGAGSCQFRALPQQVVVGYLSNQYSEEFRWFDGATDAEQATVLALTADGVTLTLTMP